MIAGVAAGAGIGLALLMRSDDHTNASPHQTTGTGSDQHLPDAWKREVASFVYASRTQDGGEKMFSVEATVFGAAGFRQIGSSFTDAVNAAQSVARTPIHDPIHKTDMNQAQGVFQAKDGAYWIAPLGGFHRGAEDALFIDGPFWDQHGISVQVLPHTPDLKAVVGVHTTIDLRDMHR